MADLFRKKSLEKLSSPEQLDKMIVINSPMTWLALVGGGLILLITVIWGFVGRIPITEKGSGILLNEGVLHSVYAGTQGVITKSYVSSGTPVEKGTLLYEVGSQETVLMQEQLQERIKKVEAVTYDSVGDEVTSDNQSLINLKNQKLSLGVTTKANETSLQTLKEQYDEVTKEVNDKKKALSAAESDYYGSLSNDNGSNVEYQYNQAASEYQSASSAYQNAQTVYQSAKSNYQTASAEYSQAEKEVSLLKEQYEEAVAYYESLAGSENQAERDAAQEYYNTTVVSLQKKYTTAKQQLSEKKSGLDSLEKAKNTAEKDYNSKKSAYESAKKKYESKKSTYEKYVKGLSKNNSNKTKYANNYNVALNEYNTAKSQQISLEAEIKSMELQLELGEDKSVSEEDSLIAQFDSAKAAILDELNQQLANYDELIEGMQIKADTDGVIFSTFVTNGSPVSIDTEVARISDRETDAKMQAVYFMSLAAGKNVKRGMRVNIYPSNLPEEEYGHMSGTVISVADYVTSYADLCTRLGDTTLAQSFSQIGAVIEVVCEIDVDDLTASGYAWSSQKGENVDLTEGTLLGGSIVIESVPPITMLIPKLKEKIRLD